MSNMNAVNSKSVVLSSDAWGHVCTFLPVQEIALSRRISNVVRAGTEKAFLRVTSVDLDTARVGNIHTSVSEIGNKCTKLRRLCLSDLPSKVNWVTAASLTICQELESLSLKNCCGLRDDSMELIGRIPSLKELEFVDCWRISPEGIITLLKTATQLRTLGLVNFGSYIIDPTAGERFHKFPKFSIKNIVPSMKNLTALDLTKIKNVSSKRIVTLVKQCPGLKLLNLTKSGLGSPEFNSQLQEANPNLKVIGLEPPAEQKKE